MRFKIITAISIVTLMAIAAFPEASSADRKTISFDEYISGIEKTLPELKSNEMDILSAENKVKSAKSGGDTSLTAGGTAFSNTAYSGINNKGDVDGYDYYAGLSKTITSTGTTLSSRYNYSKNSYSNFSLSPDYSSFEPSLTVKVTQPILYNFLGKVDRYSVDNAKMQLEIAGHQLQQNNKSVLNAYKKLYFQWIAYKENIRNLDEAVNNSIKLKDQVKRKMEAGLSDNDDYQNSIASILGYENQRRENLTALKNIESQMNLYIDTSRGVPEDKAFDEYYHNALEHGFAEINFKNTTSAKIMDLTLQNYSYSKGVYENRLLPELDIFAGITQKNISGTRTYDVKDRDYNVGFEFKYSLGNNSAESALQDVDIQIKNLGYEYKSTENSYRKLLLNYIESSKGLIDQIKNKEKTLKALESKILTEKKKYSQARLSLSYLINTENSINTEKINVLTLKYQLISNYIDYNDLVK